MTVRVEKLQAPALAVFVQAVLGLLSATTVVVMRWWQRPTPMVMSDEWLYEQARFDSQRGSR